MISGLIARLDGTQHNIAELFSTLVEHPAIEIGELIEGRKLPLTIDAVGKDQTEEITRWVQSQPGIAFVDVVYVHFEDTDGPVAESP